MYFIPSIPYREEPYPPYWGTINSQTNFCEEDHIITTYIAEFINTLTNITYLYYAYKGIRANTNRQDAIIRNLPYLGLAGVGILSALFHSTNKYWTQWFDDTSMLIATSTVVHRVFTYDKSFKYTVIYGSSLFIFMVAFIAWHCITDETLIHPILFGIEIAFVGIKTRSIINLRVADKLVQKQVKKLVTYGGVIFITGFILWNIDNTFCASLTQTKRSIGIPWSFVLELHGWWHVLTGIGAYIFIALVEYLTSSEAGQELGKNFAWPVGMISGGGKTHLIIDDRVGDIDGVMELGKGKGGGVMDWG
ncbi:hypothetical protein sscle_08g063850 [Sclerotinia sclerotiorum 1980 UF-70]|uniref:Alkaline phytoceramidase n=1 Tax=Sclerotinia sclerotiorum (strain ATCC 18683 / 1980 / Ss-1) TaxID=665079 RepID=A0A1D9Q9L7_SCLS1|nr:hypothetical protein sscle_08g063850 [Sclerotinia sclerotiorum 1980 UF-70]